MTEKITLSDDSRQRLAAAGKAAAGNPDERPVKILAGDLVGAVSSCPNDDVFEALRCGADFAGRLPPEKSVLIGSGELQRLLEALPVEPAKTDDAGKQGAGGKGNAGKPKSAA